jgi:hypothetical protein
LDNGFRNYLIKANKRDRASHPFNANHADLNQPAVVHSFNDGYQSPIDEIDVPQGLVDMGNFLTPCQTDGFQNVPDPIQCFRWQRKQ